MSRFAEFMGEVRSLLTRTETTPEDCSWLRAVASSATSITFDSMRKEVALSGNNDARYGEQALERLAELWEATRRLVGGICSPIGSLVLFLCWDFWALLLERQPQKEP
jgi:hypothetical protein